MFKLNIFATKKPSGQIDLLHVVPEIVEDKDTLFSKAVKEVAINTLAKDIRYELDCVTWGKDRVDQTLAANSLFRKREATSTEIKEAYPLAMSSSGYFEVPKNHASLATALAKKWVEENY